MNPKRPTEEHFVIKLSKVKDKEIILKAAREKQLITYKATPIRLSADFFQQKLCRPKGSDMIYSKLKGRTFTKNILPGKVIIQN